jgi:hypothetical protein
MFSFNLGGAGFARPIPPRKGIIIEDLILARPGGPHEQTNSLQDILALIAR